MECIAKTLLDWSVTSCLNQLSAYIIFASGSASEEGLPVGNGGSLPVGRPQQHYPAYQIHRGECHSKQVGTMLSLPLSPDGQGLISIGRIIMQIEEG